MIKTHELMFRMLAVIAGASVTTLNLVVGYTLSGEKKQEMFDYSQHLKDELMAIAEELGEEWHGHQSDWR